MANSKTALKRIRINRVKRARNISSKSAIKTHIRKYNAAVANGDTDNAATLFSKTSSLLDKAASKGVIHKNNAARHKSRLARKK